MNLKQIAGMGRLAFIHNPKHFFPNSFYVVSEGQRRVVMGRAKPHLNKGFRRVAILK